jgi:hypothetical protein
VPPGLQQLDRDELAEAEVAYVAQNQIAAPDFGMTWPEASSMGMRWILISHSPDGRRPPLQFVPWVKTKEPAEVHLAA